MGVFIYIFTDMQGYVAFSAYPLETRRYSNGTTVQFDNAITNIGESYYKELGIFQCPIDGIYLFSISFQTGVNAFMHGHIVKNGVGLLSSWAENENDVQSSTVVVTECLALETVWVECIGDNRELLGNDRSSFSGILITPYV